MNREQQILDYVSEKGEARLVDILAKLNTMNPYAVSRCGLAVTLSDRDWET